MDAPGQARLERLGRYQLISELGRGGMGIVYRAVDSSLERIVALKVVRTAEFDDPDERSAQRARLLREARAGAILNHPGIVTVYEINEDQGVAYIAMEFVRGAVLADLLKKQPIPKRNHVFNILRQAASALDYAHGKGVIHRDIKPANLMIQEGGVVKIMDFGIAKAAVASMQTKTGVQLGTPFYMPPEQILGKGVDGRADQYSLAVVAYQMLTGECPFSADSLPTLIYRILQEEPKPDVLRLANVGGGMEAALGKALSKQPENRFESCTEFVSALTVASG